MRVKSKKTVFSLKFNLKFKSKFYLTLMSFTVAMGYLSGAFASAEVDKIEAFELAAAKRAITSQELQKDLALTASLKIQLAVCQIQKRERLIPTGCFAAAQLAEEILPNQYITPSVGALEKECLQIAKVTTQQNLDFQQSLSPTCLRAAIERVRINRYKNGYDY